MAAGVVGLLVGVTWLSGSLGGVWQTLANRRGPGHTLALSGDSTRVGAPGAAGPTVGPDADSRAGWRERRRRHGRLRIHGLRACHRGRGKPLPCSSTAASWAGHRSSVSTAPGVRTITVRDSARRFDSERSVLVLSGDTVAATFRVLP
jgi:hypothetical protein